MPKFEIYRDTSGGWRWRLVATNGRIVADSAESYSKKSNAVAAAKRVGRCVAAADVVVEDGTL